MFLDYVKWNRRNGGVLVRVSELIGKNDLYLAALVPYVPDHQMVIPPVTVVFVQWPMLSFVRVDEWHANKPSHENHI